MIFHRRVWQLGIVLGLGLATAVAQLTQMLLHEVRPRDPHIFGGVVVALVVTALLACLIHARRAAGVDPLVALRNE